MATRQRKKDREEVAIAALMALTDILGPVKATEAPEGYMNAEQIADKWNLSQSQVRAKLRRAKVAFIQVKAPGGPTVKFYEVNP